MAFGGSIGFDLLGKDAGPVLQACTDLVYPSLHDVRRLQARHARKLHGVVDRLVAVLVREQVAVRPVAHEGVGVAPVQEPLREPAGALRSCRRAPTPSRSWPPCLRVPA